MSEQLPRRTQGQDAKDETRDLALAGAREDSSRRGSDPTFQCPTLETPRDPPIPAEVAVSIPGYKVLREIHRGGQGVVYQAIQQSTRRKVAIKVMKEGPHAGPADVARFEREVHILAQLNHPNIVAVHESGVAFGNRFFVMDYISGQCLDEYARSPARPLSEVLALFEKVCEAVNAAHLRGIIHRDLKPSNIRVDVGNEPHVLDFGLAKTLLGDSESSVMTLTGQFMGSLPWASPEQAEAEPSKIDLRTDVYSLGVILYQMLTGRFPYEVSGSIREVLDRIIRVEPTRPSTIRKKINDEVETIVLKCLAKERERRYQSAGELARDLRHYLAGEPIEAKRDSAWYIITKTMRRHRVPATFGLALLVLLFGFAITMTVAYGRVNEEKNKAEQERHKAELVASFLTGVVAKVDPDLDGELLALDSGRPLNKSLRETADAASRRIAELADQPEVQARVRSSLGRLYINLGQYAEAERHLRPASDTFRQLYGNRHAATAEAIQSLAWVLKERSAYDEAERLYTEALGTRRELFGDQDLAVAETLNGLGQLNFAERRYPAAEQYLRQALDMRRSLNAPERDIASSIANLGSAFRDAGQPDEAQPLLQEALARRQKIFGDRHFHTIVSKNKLGLLLRDRGDLPAAHALLETALSDRRALLGDHHPHVAVSLNNLALVLQDEGRYADAVQNFQSAVSLWRETLDPDHPNLAQGLINLAAALHDLGDHEADLERCEEALAILAGETALRAQALALLGRLRCEHGDATGAEPLLRDALALSQRTVGAQHPRSVLVVRELGNCLTAQGRYAEAEPLLLESFSRVETASGQTGRETVRTAKALVRLYTDWQKPAEADEYRAFLPDESGAGSPE
jgi:eukaryotic-like serine/threonine-protein kinase